MTVRLHPDPASRRWVVRRQRVQVSRCHAATTDGGQCSRSAARNVRMPPTEVPWAVAGGLARTADGHLIVPLCTGHADAYERGHADG